MSVPASKKVFEHAPHASTTARRSFTLPARPAIRSTSTPAARNSSDTPDTSDGIETLFICSTAKIVSFTASSPAKRHSPSRTPRARGSPPRSIAWTSPTERTLAVGMDNPASWTRQKTNLVQAFCASIA
jgi:hypothetical protein